MELSRRKALSQTMAKVRASIEQIRGRGEHVSEQDTKSILIEPMLAALGWELNELDDVRREYRYKSQDNPVDYALFIFGRPRRALNLGLYICSRRSAAFPMVRSGAAPRGVARESPSTLAASRRRLHIDVLSRLSFKVITSRSRASGGAAAAALHGSIALVRLPAAVRVRVVSPVPMQ